MWKILNQIFFTVNVQINIPEEPQITGALGAAYLALNLS